MPLTLQQLISKTEVLLAQSAGSAVQTYAEPRIANYIQDAFNSLFLKAWWPQFCDWQTVTLDGTTGKPNADPTVVNRFIDIRVASPAGTNKKLKLPPADTNPTLFTGSNAMFMEGVAGPRVFRVWPFTTTDQIIIHGRRHPGTFALTQTVDFDETLLTMLAAWKYATSDGNNPAEAERMLQEFNTHLNLILHNLQNLGIPLDYRYDGTLTQWMEVPS